MKALIDGVWHSPVRDRAAYEGSRAAQEDDLFHGWVTADGSSGFMAEAGRYHLYVSYACPFAHRTVLAHKLMGLEETVDLSVLHPRWSGPDGWIFSPDPNFPEVTEDRAGGRQNLWQIFVAAAPQFTGKVVVPVLWDRRERTIVSTESADIMRMFATEFRAFATTEADLVPEALRAEIDRLGAEIRSRINGGVYRAGFAETQEAYEAAVRDFFQALDAMESLLADGRSYLLGDAPTEVDWLLFPTLVRLDAAYHGALKCNLKRLADYPALTDLTGRLHALPGIADTVKLDHVKRHYYDDLGEVDPTIVPLGPEIGFLQPA